MFAHPGYVRAARGIDVPGRHQLFLHGCDVSRDASGDFLVNADWTQAPSGAGYALADRRVVAHAIPDLYERIGPRPASPWAQALRLALIDAAPDLAEEPVVVVLSPGIHSETAFDQAYLAGVLGFPLVESADLVVRDGKLWMRSLGTLKRVDVVLRRVDADYADPLDLRADSRLGVVGLVEVLRRGAVTVVNTLGSGILESPGLLRFLPELAERLLGETPLLATAPTYWGGIDVERSHLLSHLSTLSIKPVTGGEAIIGPALSATQREDLAARIGATPWQWVGQELPQFSSAPTDLQPGGLSAGSVGMRLFTVAQRGGYAPMIGGLGYLLAPGNAAYRMNTVAAKDIWVRTPTRVTAERTPTPSVDLPAITPSPTRAVSSPRVLSDLFWLGRYAERAESMARLLTVTRERYHEFRYRREMPGSECVPVLLTALGRITGTDAGADGDDAEMVAIAPTTLWSLTADRHRPGSLAQSVERVGLASRAVRDQMSNDTWMVLAARRARRAASVRSAARVADRGGGVPGRRAQPDAGGHVGAVRGGRRVDGAGRRLDRDGHRQAHRAGHLAGGAAQRHADHRAKPWRRADDHRVRAGGVRVVGDLPQAHTGQGERGRGGGSGAVRRGEPAVAGLPVRAVAHRPQGAALVVGIVAAGTADRRGRRAVAPARPCRPRGRHAQGTRAELADLLDGIHANLRELSGLITATHLSLPGGMQPLWGPDERRVMP